MKTIKQLLMTVAMLLCSAAVTAHDFEVDGIYYDIICEADFLVQVTYKGDDYSVYDEYEGRVVIPSTVVYNQKKYIVTSVGSFAFAHCNGLTSITIPNSVTSIEADAFSRCDGLKTITIGNSVTSIGDYAFYECTGLTSIVIPNGVLSIGQFAFFECNNLSNITFPNSIISIGQLAFYGTAWYNKQPNGVVYAGKVLYKYKGISPTSIDIKSGTLAIAGSAFYECYNLRSINFPNTIVNVGPGAFTGTPWFDNISNGAIYVGKVFYEYKGEMPSGTSIKIEDGTLAINSSAFSGCSGLTSVTIPKSVTSIGNWAFAECSGLKSIEIPNSVTNIGDYAFSGCSGLSSITIPYSVTSIGNNVFNNCKSLKKLHFEDGENILSLGYKIYVDGSRYALFYDCPLESIYLGRNLSFFTMLNERISPFYDKQQLAFLTIGNSVTTIRENTFHKCPSIKLLTIPQSVTTIGKNAFTDCTSLNDIIYTSSTPPTSLWLAENTYVLNKDAYGKSIVSGGSGNLIEYVTFSNATYTYGDTPKATFANNLENIDYTANATFPKLPKNAGTHTIEIPFTFSKGESEIEVNIPYKYTINKAPLIVKADTLTRLYGENNPNLTISYTGFVNGEDESVLTNKGVVTTSAMLKSDVGEYLIRVSGVKSDNYEVQYENGVLHIEKAPLTVIANNLTRVYGDENPKYTLMYSGLKNNETSPEMITAFNIATDATKTSDVGEYDIVVSGGEAKNYEITNYTNGKLLVTKAPLTIKANNATKMYGDANPTFELSCSGLKNDDTLNAIFSTTPVIACSVTNNSDVGEYDIAVSGGEAKNYEVTNYTNGTLCVTKAPLTITANNSIRLYGDKNPIFEYVCTGLKNSDNPNEIFEIEPQSVCGATKNSSVGEYEINFVGGKSKNYSITNNVKGILTVEKAPLTVIANNLTRVYGDENPKYTLTYSGLKNGETSPEMVAAFNIATDATKTSDVGEYDIVVSGGEAKNYEITNYTNGKLLVAKAPLIVTASNATKIYGEENPEFKYSYSGTKNNDSDSAIFEKMPKTSCIANETSNVGEYEIEIGDASSNNYEILYKSGILLVNKRQITVSTKNYTRKYGEENPKFEIYYNGFVNNNDESSLLIQPKIKTIAKKDSDVGVYDINIEGGDDDNYSFAYNNGILTIEKVNQIITWEQEFDDLVVGSQIELTAKASSGLDIEYIIPDNNFLSVYTVGRSTYLDCYDAGEIVVRAIQNGNKNYNAAVRVSKVIKIVPTSINSVSVDTAVNVNGNSITLSGANNSTIAIYTANGALVEKIDTYAGEEITLNKGVYIVKVGNKTMKMKL